ncbi:hypothetical protein BD410DRAFT_782783 [Rickenella mellea]|uniref:Sterol regulatory element-binding protein cleavage-activating protein n=1 Tax=Rickenella mellea TaxID=50990 RepID=A0A4Y7QKA0_9AGAM|nr:hypothetical protein BD410DRAFT_782783 [Rickenella mellea]
MRRALSYIRGLSAKFFHRFGIHCATHQTRLILISGLVITSLFYPALAIYTSSNSKPLRHFSTRILDSFLDPETRLYHQFEDDVGHIWAGHDVLRVREDSVTRARCGMERTIRLERVLVQNTALDDAGAINHQTLLSTLKMETALTELLSLAKASGSQKSSCLSFPNGKCIAISPLEFWSHDEQTLLSDNNLPRTLQTRQNVSVGGVTIYPPMTLAGRESSERSSQHIDFASFLAVTYLFHEDDCLGSLGHNTWLEAVDKITSHIGDVTIKPQEPLLLALEFDPELKNTARISVITVFLYLSYIIFFVYFSGSMSRMNTVHSRAGLCFTGLVEILCSTITSLSVCAIGGLRITMVPWGILPIVLVFVGAENMFRLIDEVVKTPITLPVKERIGVGLSRAGTSNTLKVVSYNATLGVIGFFARGAIRQFCVFAIVVLVAHWFLIHTFFVAVLSIDIQRLELDELLRQGATLSPTLGNKEKEDKPPSKPHTKSGVLVSAFENKLRGRITKNVSLLLLLAITGTLYYASQPATTKPKEVPITRASMLRTKAVIDKTEAHSQAWHLWKVLNPDDEPLVHLRIEAPIVLTLRPEDSSNSSDRRNPRSRWSLRTIRPLMWLFKIMILPIAATVGCLYALCLYLLKDADLLEAQRNKEGSVDQDGSSHPIDEKVTFTTLPRTSVTDLAILSASDDRRIVASASLEGEIKIWIADKGLYVLLDTTDLLLRSATTSSSSCAITVVAVESSGKYVGVGTGSGVVGLWEVRDTTVLPLPHLHLDVSSFAASSIHFDPELPSSQLSTPLLDITSTRTVTYPTVLVSYENGAIIRWCISSSLDVTHTQITPSRPSSVTRSTIMRPLKGGNLLATFFVDDGTVEVTDTSRTPSPLGPECVLQAGNPSDLVSQATACIVDVDNSPRIVIAATTHAGVISLWDGTSQECIFILPEAHGSLSHLSLFAVPPKPCSQCGELPMVSFILAFSVAHVVVVHRAFASRRCSCPQSQTPLFAPASSRDSFGRRSRSGSFVSSSGVESPSRTRSRVPSLSGEAPMLNMSSFPVSGHGGHARRASDKEQLRRSMEKSGLPVSFDDGDSENQLRIGPADEVRKVGADGAEPNPASRWLNFRLMRSGEATCERGGWGVMGKRIVGIRRKSRLRDAGNGEHKHLVKHPHSRFCSLSTSVLERWEVWILDPSRGDCKLQSSTLSQIQTDRDNCNQSSREMDATPRLPFTRLTSVLVADTFCLAGFGNTAGVVDFS